MTAWAGGGGGGGGDGNPNTNAFGGDSVAASGVIDGEGVQAGPKGGRKGKGKQKQTLFTLGSFPT